MYSASGAEFTKYRARQRCRRTKARQSAKVGSFCGTTRSSAPGSARRGSTAGPARSPARTAPTGPAWCGRWPGPTTGVGSPARDGPGFLKGHLDRPAHDHPRQDLHRRGLQVGTEEGFHAQFPLGVRHQDIADGDRGQAGVYHRAVREKTHSCFALAPVPVHLHRLPGGIRALRPALQAALALAP